jgi:hypothetical protein
MIGLDHHLVGRGALPSTRLFGDRRRIEMGFSTVMGQGINQLERGSIHWRFSDHRRLTFW